MHTVPVGGELGGLRAQGCSARPTAISQEQRGFTCKLKHFGDKNSSCCFYFSQLFFLNERRRCSHVAGRREEDGNAAEEAGGHDQRPQVCHKPGKFAGKLSPARYTS